MISSSSQKLRDYERKLLLPRNEDGHKVTQEVIRGDQEDKRKNDRQFAKEVVQESFELQERVLRLSPSSTIKFHRIQNRELAIDG